MNRRVVTSTLVGLLFIVFGIMVFILPSLPRVMAGMNIPNETVASLNESINKLCSADLCTVSAGISPERVPVVSKGFMLLFSLVVTGLSLSSYYYLKGRLSRYEKLRRQVVEFLPIVASLAQTRTTTVEVLKMAANLMEDPLRTYLLRMVHLITLGEDPETASKRVAQDAPVEVKAVFDAVAIGAKSGGRFGEVLERSNEYFMEVLRMERAVKDRLSEYKMIALLASLTFIAASVVALKLISSIVSGIGSLPSASQVNVGVLESALFITSVIVSLMSSLVVGKVIEGHTLKALKYIGITMLLNGLAFSLYQFII